MNNLSGTTYHSPVIETHLTSPVGLLALKASSVGLTHLTVVDLQQQSSQVTPLSETSIVQKDSQQYLEQDITHAKSHIKNVQKQLDEYFSARRKSFDAPLAPKGTEFQQQVWQALAELPFGQTCSYADIASSIHRPKAVRAVGAANGANPIAIIVPCHRVIGKSGKLTGYAYGLEMKQFLLNLESQ
ncbi:methylated-DNA--[protein]-cysteine S-methyltransferase [Shewanella gaetbuli]|uniref:Methylated-DNA--protein-cysteine methyltransferase n=1 Tax=Shewanella gaetbuli TaxID=220752 RepID=A0A9X1ZKM0_9GAMM|nr:methylated-DNA--[protein]-cysteine S-methyltransferase [Shewanella gaetbuli]MCL1141577.1 methylated-DNA--[protein]-cysteine S-methyltransferase [Shewanella gaetbuli]